VAQSSDNSLAKKPSRGFAVNCWKVKVEGLEKEGKPSRLKYRSQPSRKEENDFSSKIQMRQLSSFWQECFESKLNLNMTREDQQSARGKTAPTWVDSELE
jgi:hypothetical protein